MRALFTWTAALLWAALATPALSAEVKVGQLVIDAFWARATAPAQPVGAAYLTITNRGVVADRLVAAASPVANKVELHTHTVDAQGVARMRQVDAIEVESGAEVSLAPGGLHIMLIGLAKPLTAGERFPLTLRFAQAGEVTVQVQVQAAGARPPAGGHGTH